jgi:hypothetical protein
MANDRIRSGLKKGARFMPKRLHKRLRSQMLPKKLH